MRQVAHAQARACVHRLGGDVAAVEHDLALVGRDQADDHVEAGGLAGAVGAEQADDFARVQGQAEVAHDLARAVALAQSLGDEHYSSSCFGGSASPALLPSRSEEHTSELQSIMSYSDAVFCVNKTRSSDL